MSISQPSHEIYYINVPEVKHLEAVYHYNFFTPNECVSDTGGVPSNILVRPGSEIDSDFIQYSMQRAPRVVSFSWTNPKLADVGNQVNEQALRNNAFKSTGKQKGSLILDNIDKVVSEDNFSTNNFTSINFHDGEIDDKVHELVSGSMMQATLEEASDPKTSPYKAAQRLIPLLPHTITPHFIFQAMTIPKAIGATFYMPAAASASASTGGGLGRASTSSRVTSEYFRRLKAVKTNTQINNKFIKDLVNRTITDPTTTHAGALVNMHQYAKQAQHATNQRFSPAVSDRDYKSFVPYVSVKHHGSAGHTEKYGAELVGYIIDKFEITKNGKTKRHDPIVIDSPHPNVTADFRVKFNSKYCYTIRTIALLTTPAINDDDGSVATVQMLVSSKPSNKVYVSTLKLDAPPPPGDVSFYWNYQINPKTGKPFGLMVTWAFPVTSERDIAQFQIFRREHTNHCFELQKQYNFGTSVVTWPLAETPDPSLVEHLKEPVGYWRDEDFNMDVNSCPGKGLIYAVGSIDEHGLISQYSAQYRVWYDLFQNKIVKELVSHMGAPMCYPNLYLDGDLFVNSIRVSGPHSQTMKLYFNPEYYYLYDDRNRYVKVLQTQQDGGSYRMQFINTDNAKSQTIDINIDDRTKISSKKLSYPMIRFGPQRVALPNFLDGRL